MQFIRGQVYDLFETINGRDFVRVEIIRIVDVRDAVITYVNPGHTSFKAETRAMIEALRLGHMKLNILETMRHKAQKDYE